MYDIHITYYHSYQILTKPDQNNYVSLLVLVSLLVKMVPWMPGPVGLMYSMCGTVVDLVSYFHSDLKKMMLIVITIAVLVIILIIIMTVFIERFP